MAAIDTHTVTGTVKLGSAGFAGVVMTVSGDYSTSTVTNGSGNYSLTLDALGNYTLTPSSTGYHFSPVSVATASLLADWAVGDIAVTIDTFPVSGTASAGTLLTVSGSASTSAVVGAGGTYSFELDYGGAYTLTPTKTGYHYSPVSASTAALVANWINNNFTATIDTYTVSGTVTEGTSTLAGVTITVSGSSTTSTVTNGAGYYSFDLEYGGAYTLTATKTYYQFVPVNVSTGLLAGTWTGNDFAATYGHTLNGTIKVNGVPVAGVTVAVTGTTTTYATTDNNGNYTLVLIPAGNYTITPTKTGYYFNPPTLSISSMTADITQDFRTGSTEGSKLFVEGGDNGYVQPSKGPAKIRLTPTQDGHITIKVYTARNARLIRTLETDATAGNLTTVIWDCLNTDGETVGSGVYLVVINGGGYDNEKIKMGVLR